MAFHQSTHHVVIPEADADELDLHKHHHNHQGHYERDHDQQTQHKPRGLPVIPDLRFESSYVRSVQGFVSVERVGPAPVEEQEQEDRDEGFEKVDASVSSSGKGIGREERTVVARKEERITVQWGKVVWVTVRDQVVSPLVQGALWALASYYIRPFSAEIGSKMGTFVRGGLPTIRKEGSAVSWLRGWAKGIGLSGLTSGGAGAGGPGSSSSSGQRGSI